MNRIFSCLTGCLISGLFFATLATIALSLSGLVEVPFLSRILYKEPPKLPRVVYLDSFGLEEKIFQAVAKKSPISLEEGQFSYLLGEAVKSQKIKNLKTNIYPDQILLLAEKETNKTLYLTFNLRPKDSSGNFQISSLKIGHLPLPMTIMNFFLPNRGDVSISSIFLPETKIKEVNLEDKKIFIFFE